MQRLLQHWVMRQAAWRPDATAIVWKNQRLSYSELDQASSRLAVMLRETGLQRLDRVAFCLPKSPDAIIAMLGILKADGVYVPIDSECPAARVRKVLTASEPAVVLISRHTAGLIDSVLADGHLPGRPRFACLDEQPLTGAHFATTFCGTDVDAAHCELPPSQNTASDPAHILFTSGSTGAPKGVVITHANVTAYIDWTLRYFGVTEDDRVSGHAPLHFDLSTQDIFGAFAAGAELHPVPPELNLLPHKLAAFIRERRLTQWFSVPSILNYLCRFDVIRDNDFPDLRRLMWCGEVLPTPTLRYLMNRLPHVTFTNLYGPTEATIASSGFTVPSCPASDTEQIPIGTACDGEDLLVLDDHMRPTATDDIGDLYIAGVGLSPGYWRDAERTAAAFLPDPNTIERRRIYRTGDLARVDAEGRITWVGRADSQIKSRGYRIELGEIETALNALGCLDEAAVVAIDTDGFENKAICCAFVPKPDHDLSIADLRSLLAEAVPRYMIPQHWRAFQSLPRNANGKVDRPLLRNQFAEPAAVAAPASATDAPNST